MSKAIVFLAEGFEVVEGLTAVDMLRRAGTEVITAAVGGKLTVASANGVSVRADALAEDVDYSDVDIVILPGGLPGATNLAADPTVKAQCIEKAKNGKVAAICASPAFALASFGILEGKKATCYPGCEKGIGGVCWTRDKVTVDGNIITGQAPAAALPFALELVKQLEGKAVADEVISGIVL